MVIGVRAYNVRDDLAAHLPALFAYVEGGGTVVAQYNRPNGLKTNRLAPYDLRLSDARVTDENAPVTFLAPDHPVLTTPNKITEADMEGWVQERGIYFPTQWDCALHADPRVGRPGRDAAEGGPARGEARPRPLRLHGARVLPATSRRGPRGLPTLRQPGLARQMTHPRRRSSRPAAPARPRGRDRRTGRPDCRGRAPGRASTRSCSAASSRGWCSWSCSSGAFHEPARLPGAGREHGRDRGLRRLADARAAGV